MGHSLFNHTSTLVPETIISARSFTKASITANQSSAPTFTHDILLGPSSGKSGKVIGVDMTPDMISSARMYAEKSNYDNVEFRLGEIEHLPVEINTVDIIISNCVINLVPNKDRALQEASS